MKTALLLLAASFSLCAQSITWTKVWTAPNTGTFGTYLNGYHDIHYDPYTQKTWIYSTDTSNTGAGIYSIRLHYFDSTNNTDTVIGDNGQPSATSTGCYSAQTSPFVWPGSHHAVGQFVVDQVRHLLLSFQGTSCADVFPDQYTYQLVSPIPSTPNKNWAERQSPHAPILNSQNRARVSTLSASISAADTSISLAAPAGFGNNEYLKIDSEIMKITAGGGSHGYVPGSGGSAGTNPLTVIRGQLGTTAVAHHAGANVYQEEGQFNNGSIVHDTDDDAFFLLGLPQTGADEFWVYCDTTQNPTPGTLTSAQSTVGCSRADDWTSISAKSICSDSHCVALATGANGPNSGKVPPGTYYPNLEYDHIHRSIIQWAGSYGASNGQNLTFVYNPKTFSWTNLNPSCSGTDCINGAPLPQSSNSENFRIAHAEVNGKYYYHLTRRPSSSTGNPQDWVLDPSVPSWTEIQSGQGPNYGETMTYDSGCGCLVAWAASTSGQSVAEIWVGTLSAAGSKSPTSNPTITTSSPLPSGTQFTSYSTTLAATGGTPITWARTSGQLPAGLSLNSATGTITGTATQAGIFSFAIQASNSTGTNSKSFSLTITSASNPTLSLNLTIQEALYPGSTPGIPRSNEPFCQGLPIADSSNITDINNLTLSGASAGQFRVLGTWPDGNIKWVQVCGILPSLSAGGTATVTLTNGGSGNFGGSSLATDNGSTIAVATGTSTFTVKKANYNVLDAVSVGSNSLLSSSTSATRGLILLGPSSPGIYPNDVSCGTGTGRSPCTTIYSSANDPNSTCIVEQNGPVLAVLRCTGNHMDASGDPYMQYTAREYFYQNENYIKIDVVLRNANYSGTGDCNYSSGCQGGTFNVAYKGFQSYELRLSPSITGTLAYAIANNTGTPTSGTLNQTGGTDTAYIYQGQSNSLQPTGSSSDFVSNAVCSTTCRNTFTTDTGWRIVKNGSTVASGAASTTPQGWADISDSSGNGMEIGVYQMGAYWPKSLEFDSGGNDLRIGIRPSENSKASYMAWPAWDWTTTWIEFHTSPPSSMANDFLKFQHFLTARASPSYYNSTGVFYGHHLLDPTTEGNYYASVAASSSPAVPRSKFLYQCASGCISTGSNLVVPDRGTTLSAFPLATYRYYDWPIGGGGNQEEFRWSDIMRFLSAGQTGRYLNALHFYRFQSEITWPHSDGTSMTDSTPNHFQWHTRPEYYQSKSELDPSGYPVITGSGCQSSIPSSCSKLANASQSYMDIPDPLHAHWYGEPDAYFLSGDETFREAMYSKKSWFLNPQTYQHGLQGSGQAWAGTNCGNQAFCYTRSFGIAMMGAARFGAMLSATGDSDASDVLAAGAYVYTNFVKPDVCVTDGSGNHWPSGCTPASSTDYVSPVDPQGVSRVRGVHISARAAGWCPFQGSNSPNFYRVAQTFQHSILEKGLLELRNVEGSTWSDYDFAGDLAYGTAQFVMKEMWNDDGTPNWQSAIANGLYNGPRYMLQIDQANQCSTPSKALGTSGTVTTNGTAVTWASGRNFSTVSAGDSIGINGTSMQVQRVNSSTSLTLTARAGLNRSPVPWEQGLVTPVAIGAFWPKSGNGFANINNGTSVALASGNNFDTDGSWNGLSIAFAGSNSSHISSVTDGSDLVLSSSVPDGTNQGYTINPGIYQIGSNAYDVSTLGQPCQGCWDIFYSLYAATGQTLTWSRQFRIQLAELAIHSTNLPPDFGSVDIGDAIYNIQNTGNVLQGIPFTLTNLGSGSYQLTFTPPSGSTSLRIKWSPLQIASSTGLLGYDNLVSQQFALSPAMYSNWFAANTTAEPKPIPGSQQAFTISTGVRGLTAANFSVKVFAPTSESKAQPSGNTTLGSKVVVGGKVRKVIAR